MALRLINAPGGKHRGGRDKKVGVLVYETTLPAKDKAKRGVMFVRSKAMPTKAAIKRALNALVVQKQVAPVVTEARSREIVILPRAKYDALLQRLEDLEDAVEVREAEERGTSADALPSELVDRLIEGEHPLRIWREHRKLTLAQLAERSGVGLSYISEIEHGQKPGSAQALKALAAALGVDTDDLIR